MSRNEFDANRELSARQAAWRPVRPPVRPSKAGVSLCTVAGGLGVLSLAVAALSAFGVV